MMEQDQATPICPGCNSNRNHKSGSIFRETPEQSLEKKREAIREIARKLGPEALADFERQFGKKP